MIFVLYGTHIKKFSILLLMLDCQAEKFYSSRSADLGLSGKRGVLCCLEALVSSNGHEDKPRAGWPLERSSGGGFALSSH